MTGLFNSRAAGGPPAVRPGRSRPISCRAALPVLAFILAAVAPAGPATAGSRQPDALSDTADLTPSQQYAGELLGYLLKLVLGRAGDPGTREEWRTTGLNESLDYDGIRERMTNPEKSELGLLVLDPKILGLMRILYHYDPELNLHKRSSTLSVYPAPEFVAIRLLLLKRIHEGRKFRLQALIERRRLFVGGQAAPSQEDLEALNLSAREIAFLRDIIRHSPHFFQYLQNPFLCKALYEVGAVYMDKFVWTKTSQANYQAYRCRIPDEADAGAVRVLVLPSFMGEFHPVRPAPAQAAGLAPTKLFRETVERLKEDIRSAARDRVSREIAAGNMPTPPASPAHAPLTSEQMVSFFVVDERPLVVYPDNAGQVIQDVCPEADFTVILLDKNVYLAIHFREEGDAYPSVPWFYTDILDVRYDQYQDQLDAISRFVVARLGHEDASVAPTE